MLARSLLTALEPQVHAVAAIVVEMHTVSRMSMFAP